MGNGGDEEDDDEEAEKEPSNEADLLRHRIQRMGQMVEEAEQKHFMDTQDTMNQSTLGMSLPLSSIDMSIPSSEPFSQSQYDSSQPSPTRSGRWRSRRT